VGKALLLFYKPRNNTHMRTFKLFFLAAILFSLSAGTTKAKPASANISIVAFDGVTASQVMAYLVNTMPPHTVYTTPTTSNGGLTWHCVTSKRGNYYNTTVYTDGTNIVGYEDFPIG
jgi:hypothetical protein